MQRVLHLHGPIFILEATEMASNPKTLMDLRTYLLAGRAEIDILNYYKGVPFICKAAFPKVVEEHILFTLQPPNSILMHPGGVTTLLSDGLLDPILAHVHAFDVRSGVVELYDFNYTPPRLGNRREVRVEPDEPITVAITHGEQKLQGLLCDVSMGGAGIHIDEAEQIHRGETIRVAFQLPNGQAQQTGQIVRSSDEEDACRLAVNFTGTSPDLPLVMRYIFERREQIRAEVAQLFDAALSQAKREHSPSGRH
jgi:hypothetical protein